MLTIKKLYCILNVYILGFWIHHAILKLRFNTSSKILVEILKFFNYYMYIHISICFSEERKKMEKEGEGEEGVIKEEEEDFLKKSCASLGFA